MNNNIRINKNIAKKNSLFMQPHKQKGSRIKLDFIYLMMMVKMIMIILYVMGGEEVQKQRNNVCIITSLFHIKIHPDKKCIYIAKILVK